MTAEVNDKGYDLVQQSDGTWTVISPKGKEIVKGLDTAQARAMVRAANRRREQGKP